MTDGLALLDLDLYGREINDPLQELYQDLVHRLFESPGSNPADLDRGVGLFAMLSGRLQLIPIVAMIEADLVKDDRVSSCSAAVTAQDSNGNYLVSVQVVCNEAKLGISLAVNADGTVREV
jgi:hypothetical protein